MDVIYVGQEIDINWSIRRNASEVLEDFSKADLKVFLTGNDFDGNYDGKYYFANIIDDQGRVRLVIEAGSLTPGTYCIEGIWIKNSHELLNSGWTRSISRARKDRIFKVSDVEEECTDYDEAEGHVVEASHEINIATGTTSYGYDGMSAYETAVFNGSTAKTEKEWIDTYEKAEERVNYEMDESHDGSVPGEPQSWANAELKRKQAEGQLGSSDPYYSTSRKKKEEDRQTAESNRASAETLRGTAETQRQKNEGQLGDTDPDYATSRIKKENDRQTAESGRASAESGRVSAENTRVQNEGSGGPSSAGYSTSRIKKELDRQSAENSRATAESSRQEYEGQGDYSDATEYPNTRRAKEAARQTAETARATAETARQKAEGQLGNTDPDYATSRIKQEIDRQTAEAARELAETARENAKISSTTIEYAVGDSGTTPPSSGWQSTVPSYTTGDFLWGRTTITFGDGTSKVLYAIGTVPDVAVSQNASTGKTTIKVGSDSYDVATEPVSVSQNTETGKTELKIGSDVGLTIDKEPELGSTNLVEGGGVVEYTKENYARQEQSITGGDLDICDEQNNILARFKDGELRTKNFDSRKTIKTDDISNIDFAITDKDGNEVFRVKNGYPQTKNFDGERIAKGNPNTPKVQATFTSGSTITLSNVPENVKNGSCINFGCIIPNGSAWTSLTIGKKSNTYGGVWYEITATSIIVHYRTGAPGTEQVFTTIAHGLTFDKYIRLFIQFKVNGTARIEIETFNGHYSNSEIFCYGLNTYGAPFASVSGGNLADVTFSYSSDKYKKPLWIFGDSYFGTIETRVLYYLIEWGICEDVLVNALPGITSVGSYIDFIKSTKYGCPKTIVWMLGMNGYNSDTISSIETLKTYCDSHNIELIINDVPNTPSADHNNEVLHSYVQSSGMRFVHSYEAVGSSSSGSWYSGYLSSDNVHPTELGARAIAMQMLVDVPELMQFVTDRRN